MIDQLEPTTPTEPTTPPPDAPPVEPPTVPPVSLQEQLANLQQQYQETEKQAQAACWQELLDVLKKHGYDLMALPVVTTDGRLAAKPQLTR